MERVFTNVHRYGNMSAATVPVALCEALEEGRVTPNSLLLMPSFGGGLTFTGHVLRWGERVTPLATAAADLPPLEQSALELVHKYRAIKSLRVATGP
jgi:3-oxoacyl-[acyl-carrier-protein] synthase-3